MIFKPVIHVALFFMLGLAGSSSFSQAEEAMRCSVSVFEKKVVQGEVVRGAMMGSSSFAVQPFITKGGWVPLAKLESDGKLTLWPLGRKKHEFRGIIFRYAIGDGYLRGILSTAQVMDDHFLFYGTQDLSEETVFYSRHEGKMPVEPIVQEFSSGFLMVVCNPPAAPEALSDVLK